MQRAVGVFWCVATDLLAVGAHRRAHFALIAEVEDHRRGELVDQRTLSPHKHAVALPGGHGCRCQQRKPHEGRARLLHEGRRWWRLGARRWNAGVRLLLLALLTLWGQTADRNTLRLAATLRHQIGADGQLRVKVVDGQPHSGEARARYDGTGVECRHGRQQRDDEGTRHR